MSGFAAALRARRDYFNAAFAQARHARPKLDPDAFGEHLRNSVAPIVARVPDEQAERLTVVLYDLSLEMMGTELFNIVPIRRVWSELLPVLAPLIDRRLVASLCNAAHNLARTDGAQFDAWHEAMMGISARQPQADVLLDAGKALAWRCGMAHYREGGLDALGRLPRRMAAEILNTDPESLPRWLEALGVDRWANPSSSERPGLRIVARVGAFRGFGGLFMRPPQVRVWDGEVFVGDGHAWWQLAADAFGATFHRCAEPESRSTGPFALAGDGTVTLGDLSARMPVLANAASHASTEDTLAVTLPLSHHVFLVARCR